MRQHEAVTEELLKGASDLYIFFGGIASGIAMPPFEFYKASKIIDQNKMFVRDLRQRWYQAGLLGISRSVPTTVEFLQKRINAIGPRRTFFIGNSMGGFAAILYANLIGEGMAIAFAPQTFISKSLRKEHGDRRWRRQISCTYLATLFKERHFDLATVISNSPSPSPTHIFVSSADSLDLKHASHLKPQNSVKVFEFASGGHGVVKVLRDQGQLPRILKGEFE